MSASLPESWNPRLDIARDILYDMKLEEGPNWLRAIQDGLERYADWCVREEQARLLLILEEANHNMPTGYINSVLNELRMRLGTRLGR